MQRGGGSEGQGQNEFNTKVKEAAAKSGCYAMMRHRGPAEGPGALTALGPGALPWGRAINQGHCKLYHAIVVD